MYFSVLFPVEYWSRYQPGRVATLFQRAAYAIALVQIEGEDEEVIWRWQATAIQDSQPNHSPLEAGMTATTGVGTFEMEDAQVTKSIALDGSGAASACIRYYTESVAY